MIRKILTYLNEPVPRQVDYEAILPQMLRQDEGQYPRIPLLLHQVWLSENNKPIPDVYHANIEHNKSLNPEYVHHVWYRTEVENFILEHYGEAVYGYYKRINPAYGASRADLFRMLLLYKLGGVYIDLKVTFGKPLHEIIHPKDEFLYTQWDNKPAGRYEGWGLYPAVEHIVGGEYVMGVMFMEAGHPVLRRVITAIMRNIDCYNPLVHGTGMSTLHVTGNTVYTLSVYDFFCEHPEKACRKLDINEDLDFRTNNTEAVKAIGWGYKQTYSSIILRNAWLDSSLKIYNWTLRLYRRYILKKSL